MWTTPISSNLSASGEKTATCLPKQRGFPEPSRSRSRRGCVGSPSLDQYHEDDHEDDHEDGDEGDLEDKESGWS